MGGTESEKLMSFSRFAASSIAANNATLCKGGLTAVAQVKLRSGCRGSCSLGSSSSSTPGLESVGSGLSSAGSAVSSAGSSGASAGRAPGYVHVPDDHEGEGSINRQRMDKAFPQLFVNA